MRLLFSSGLIVYLGIKGVLKGTSVSYRVFKKSPFCSHNHDTGQSQPSFYTQAGTAGLCRGFLFGFHEPHCQQSFILSFDQHINIWMKKIKE